MQDSMNPKGWGASVCLVCEGPLPDPIVHEAVTPAGWIVGFLCGETCDTVQRLRRPEWTYMRPNYTVYTGIQA